jgi:hypothetical protein
MTLNPMSGSTGFRVRPVSRRGEGNSPVPSDDLSSIQGLEDRHLRALARQNVTDLRGMVHADRQAIYRGLANLRPRPTLEQISRWQDEARTMLGETQADTSDWHPAASFVVVFSQRRAGDTWERRTEAERTEIEPEQSLQIWSGWDCEPICAWMMGQLDQADTAQLSSEPPPEAAAGPPAAEPSTGRARLTIDSAVIIDAAGQADVVAAGAVVADPHTELVAPVRVVLTVSGARPGTQLQAVARILRPDGPGWNPQDPVIVPDSGQAEFDLSRVPPGEREMALIAWAPDATANLVSISLPRMTIRPGSG